MKILKYLLLGVQEVARELGILKSIVRRKISGRALELVRQLHQLRAIALLTAQGHVLKASGSLPDVAPVLPALDVGNGVVVKTREGWLALTKSDDAVIAALYPYMPDAVDLWLLERDVKRYVWGITWEK